MGEGRPLRAGGEARRLLAAHRAPPWFEDAKLGIFVHWGLYSVPGWAPLLGGEGPEFSRITDAIAAGRTPYAEWYWNSLRVEGSPTEAYHREHYGSAPYDDFRGPFVAMLKTWDPHAWADLFAASGAGYIILTAKHADGFLLWPSEHRHPRRPDWQLERDVVGELAEAVRARGMRFGVYYCGGLDWSFVTRPIVDLASVYATVPTEPAYRHYVEAHLRELISRYRPSVLWNDISLPPHFPRDELLVDYLETVPDGTVNDRMRVVPGAVARGLGRQPARRLANRLGRRAAARGGTAAKPPYFADYSTPEYTAEPELRRTKWETCRGLGHSFGYNRAESDDDLLGPGELVSTFADIVAKNGNLLLNVGPRGEDGTIPELQADRLHRLGSWLAVHGEAVVGTRPWIRPAGRTGAGHDVRFTQRDGALYVIILGRPAPGPLVVDGIRTPGPVELLGYGPVPGGVHGGSLRLEWPPDAGGADSFVLRVGPRRLRETTVG
jgi:alpha-L-fucosidase